ncbi:glyoxylate/hydroxypyruvate reductase A [Acuticoccus sediminis]|uniref:Glyoxylate/hydroxypyruvate reductase A n=1 Tax=Acuticoccus sediminis TaxID=2184697 RepID=A0A8B2NUQ2_9HYPH|nr:glyoxylate/hydroxypyruvate reductase A [Acuticoccus sediminis]RAI00040.1 glyoxylate/hydroxypyruvate reductase A [Acuticoccus sediminis]
MTTLLLSTGWHQDEWLANWRATAPDRPILRHGQDDYDPAAIDYVLTWKPPAGVLRTLPNLKAVFNLGAGVDGLMADPDLPPVPLVRLVDDDMTYRMGEWVILQVLTHFRQALAYLDVQRKHEWREFEQPAANAARVGLMGYGTLARHCAPILLSLGFTVHGWSRSQRPSDITLYYGAEGLDAFLKRTDILVCLLPLTEDTRGILDAGLIARLGGESPLGPVLINAGRGGLQTEADILAALRSGALKGASLDVFNEEPLPADDPMWDAPNLVITPHVAAVSDPTSTLRNIVRQIEAFERGEPLRNVVDTIRGY